MSRSRRKTPIFGITTARSEAADKRQWHQRWRSRVRDRLVRIPVDEDHVDVHRNEVSSTWDLAKDGKRWFDPSCQAAAAERIVVQRARPEQERQVLQARLLAKWRAK